MTHKKDVAKQNNIQSFGWYATHTVQEICVFLETSNTNGLSNKQITDRNAQYGANTITNHEVTAWHVLFNQIKSPFIYILIIIAFINFFLNNFTDGIMVLAIVIINTCFSFYQEYRTHLALRLLKKYVPDKIRVIRNGQELELDTNQLVPGDVITLYPGDKIPADVRFISVENLTIDESTLTGESTPVQKNTDPLLSKEVTIFKSVNIGFSGTSVINGKGKGIVFTTGNNTYFGSIAMLAEHNPKLSSFAKDINQFSRFILYLIIITVSCVFMVHVAWNYSEFNFINLILFSMALGISIIPEALPIVISFSLTRGALHLAKHKMVTKRLSAIEDLGSMQLLCIDKTGTITQNRLILNEIQGENEPKIIFYALLASGLPPAQFIHDQGFNGPLWQKLTKHEQALINQYNIIAEHPFEPQLWYSSVIVHHQHQYELIVRGNVNEVIRLCINLTQQQIQEIIIWSGEESKQGHRVLAIAKKEVSQNISHITHELENDLEYIGLVSYDDPLKPTAEASLAKARSLGVNVKIISGDTKEVNFAIAQKIKLITREDQIISGEEFAKKSILEKIKIVETCSVFAHIVPDQKVEIVQLLEEKYDVGYLGDGINDAPVLKIAHVSLAVDTAADIARDAADIILLHKSLRVIVDGIHEGRIIFSNMIKYIKSTIAPNFGHFYTLSIISLLADSFPLLPSQLLLISLLTDLPLVAIATDTVSFEDINVPRKYDLKDIALITMTLGLIVMIADFIIFRAFYKISPEVLQTNWFIASVLIEVSFFYSIRTSLPFYQATFPSLSIIALSSSVALTAIALPFTAVGQKFLHFYPPTGQHLIFIGIIVIGYFIVTDIIKVLFYRIYKTK